LFAHIFELKRSFYPDRLGPNTGITQNKKGLFSRSYMHYMMTALGQLPDYQGDCWRGAAAENALFLSHVSNE
jgi:hypothetical protein